MIDLKATFEKFQWQCNTRPSRSDLAAFLLLKVLDPGCTPIIAGAERDEICLSTDCDKLAEVATEEDIQLLVQCGVRYDSDTDSLAMFV